MNVEQLMNFVMGTVDGRSKKGQTSFGRLFKPKKAGQLGM
jgi:hypothetical protein